VNDARGRSFIGAALAVLVLLTPAPPASGDKPNDGAKGWPDAPWAIARLPFAPTLTTDNDSHVCAVFRHVAEGTFRSNRFRFEPSDDSWNAPVLFSAGRNNGDDPHYPANRNEWQVNITERDLGAGHPQPLVLVAWTDFRGERNFALVRPGDLKEVADLLSSDDLISGHSQSAAILWPPNLVPPLPWREPPSVVEIDHKVFVAEAAPRRFDVAAARLYRIPPTGPLKLTCEVALQPDPKEPVSPLEQGPIADLFSTLEAIAANDGDCSGTLHPGDRVALGATMSRVRVALRPWTLRDDGEDAPYNTREVIDSDLAEWDSLSLWNHRLYRRYQELVPTATNALQAYYRDAFGLPPEPAETEAKRVVDQIIRRHFVFGNSSALDDPRAPLHRLLLEGADWQRIAPLLDGQPNKPDPTAEAPIFFALEHPELVGRLLDTGAKPDAVNIFHKTPLMYAAQFGLVETARVLLRHGADPNTRTSTASGCDPGRAATSFDLGVRIGGRTALMYAAENGSAAMISLLLDSSADKTASDDAKRSISFYLDRNTGLSAEERQTIADLLH
jgi:hypothetical protein